MAEPIILPEPGVTGAPIAPESTTAIAEASGELAPGLAPSYWETFFAKSSLHLLDAPVGLFGLEAGSHGGAIPRFFKQLSLESRDEADGRPQLSPEEANKQFNPTVPYTEPVYPSVAEFNAQIADTRRRYSAWIGEGPETGFGTDLASSFAVALDPFNIATGLAFGAVGGAVRTGIAGAAEIGLTAEISSVFIENTLATLLGEVPTIYQKPREQEPAPTASELALIAAGGGVGGTLLHMGAKGISRLVKGTEEKIKLAPKSENETTARAALAQHEAGGKIDAEIHERVQMYREAGQVAEGHTPEYRFEPKEAPHEGSYYVSVAHDGSFLRRIDLAEGVIHGVDNPQVEHNVAGAGNSSERGLVMRFELTPDAKLIPSDTPLRDLFKEGLKVREILDEVKTLIGDPRKAEKYIAEIKGVLKNEGSLKDLLQRFEAIPGKIRLPNNEIPQKEFGALLDNLGYDGMNFTGKLDGVPIDNRVILFNESQMTPAEIIEPNVESVPRITPEMALEANAKTLKPENGRNFDPALNREAEANLAEPIMSDSDLIPPEVAEIEKVDRAVLNELAKNDPRIEAELKEIDIEYKKANALMKTLDVMSKCFGGNIS